MSDPSKNFHDIHFELKATADTTTTGATDNSYVCKNGSFRKDKDNENVKTGSNLIPSNWSSVKDKVTGNYNMFWFDSARENIYCTSEVCKSLYGESTNPVNNHVTPGIGKPLFIVPDTNHVFLFARTVGSPVASGAKTFTGGQYYAKNYIANLSDTKLYQDYAKSSPVGLASGINSKDVRLRMENQEETSSGSPVNQRERLQACSQCNTGHAFSPGNQLPKKVCKRWVKVNMNMTDPPYSSQHGRNKPRRLLGKIRYNDGGSTPTTPPRDHFVPFGVANNKAWNESAVNTSNYKLQPYDGIASFWANSNYASTFRTNSDNLKSISNLWTWFPIEKNNINKHKVPLIKGIDCVGPGTTGSGCNRSGTNYYVLAHDLKYPIYDSWVYGNTLIHTPPKDTLRKRPSLSYKVPQVSADDIYCGYTAGNDNVAGTYTYDEAQKRWRSLFFQNIYYKDASNNQYKVDNDNQLTVYPDVKTNITYYSQSDNTVLWNDDKYHGCLKCPPGTKKIPDTSKNGCMRCPVNHWSKGGTDTCSSVSSNYYNNFAMSTCGKSTYSREGKVFCMDSGQVYGLRNCNARDGNNIETSAQGPRNKQVCTTTDKTYGTSKYSILNKNSTCSVDTPERTYDASDTNTCFKCTCTNGVPAGPKRGKDSGKESEGCDHEGQHKCQSCDAGYYLDSSDKKCKLRGCKCEIGSTTVGTPATGTACTSPGSNLCASCDAGYYLQGNQCKPCPNSPPKTHTNRTQTGGVRSCNIDTTIDWKNYFQGTNGCPAIGGWCITPYDQYEKRNCDAVDGNSITLKDNAQKNAKNNHHVCIQGNTAWRNANPTYDYYHGIIKGVDCTTIRAWAEKSEKPDNTCFKCTCPNGVPVGPKTGTDGSLGCSKEGKHHCKRCNIGYHLVDRVGTDKTPRNETYCKNKVDGCKCIANTCKCEIGVTTVGTAAIRDACTSPDGNICASCNKGYYLDKTVGSPTYKQCKQCPENTYQTQDGFTGSSCTSCGTNEHSSAGSTSRSSCKSNVCKCELNGTTIGTPVPSSSCTTNNGNICESCDHNYKLDGTNKCQLCPGGEVRYWGNQRSCQTPPTGLLTLYTNILNGSSVSGGPEDFNSNGKEVKNWCLNSTDNYKVRKCKLDDGNDIDVSGATKQSVTKDNTDPKQDQYHVCLRKSSGSLNFDQSSVRKTRASSGPPVFTLGSTNNIVVTSEKTFTGTGSSNDNSCFKCQCSHGKPAAPKLSLSDKTKGCEAEGKEQCQSCKPGYYLDKTVGSSTYKQCKPCPANTYQGSSNNTSDISSCTPCGGGKYSSAGSTSSGACNFYCKYNKNNTPDFRITDKTTNTEIQDGYGSSLKETDLYSNKDKYKITFVNNNKYINPINGKVKVVCDQSDDGKIKLKNTDDTPVSIKSCVIDATRCQTEYVSSGQKECSRYISKGTGYDTALSNYNSTPTAQNYYTLLTKVDKRYTRCSQAKAGYFLGDQASTNLFNRKTLNVSTSGTNEWALS